MVAKPVSLSLTNLANLVEKATVDYVECVNRAIDFILQNLSEPLRLERVADAALYSPFHFHRVFKSLVGESLNEFIKRVRLERSLMLLSQREWSRDNQSLTEIAFACGFSSSSDFTRCFKQRYGVPPSEFDVNAFRDQRRDEWQQAIADDEHRHHLDRLPTGENPDGFEVQMRELPQRTVFYHRVMDSYRPGVVQEAIEEMVSWAEMRGLADGQWLGYMWDDPEIVAHQDCRYDIGLEVPGGLPADRYGIIEFPPMLVAEVRIEGPVEKELRALDWLFRTWLPSSGYITTDQPSFEAWIGRPFAHGTEHFKILAQLPVTAGSW